MCHNTIELHTMVIGGRLLQQREIADLLLAYVPAIDAARGAMRVCRAWHDAVGRIHGKMIATVRDAVKHGWCLVFCDMPGRRTRAARLLQYHKRATFYGSVELHSMIVQFHILLQREPLLLRTIVCKGSTSPMRYQPLFKPTVHEEAAENIYYQLTGIDLRAM